MSEQQEAGMADSTADPFNDVLLSLTGVRNVTMERDERVAHVDRAMLLSVMEILKTDPRFSYEQCMDVCGVDWPDRTERFEVVYQLLSLTRNDRLRVIIATDEEQLVPSVTSIWSGACWWEREVWDLFGVRFDGLVDHRRILTDYGFEGHPLRKDFPLTGHVEVRYDEDEKRVVYDRVALTQEFRQFDFLSPWEAVTTLPGDEKALRKAGSSS